MKIEDAVVSVLPPGIGDQVVAYARSDRGLERFEALNDHNMPPVGDLSLFLYRLDRDLKLDDNSKRLLGKLVFDSMRTRDPSLVPVNGVRVTPAPYQQFVTGSLFRSGSEHRHLAA